MSLTPEEIRIIGISAPQLLGMLRTREERILGKIYGEFRNGKTDHLASLAEWASVRDQIHEINSVLNGHMKQQERLHADASRRDPEGSNI